MAIAAPVPTTTRTLAMNAFGGSPDCGFLCTASTTSTLTLGNKDATASFAGVIKDNGGSGGTVGVIKNGTGTQTTTTEYDFSTGLVKNTTDANNQTSTIDYTNQLLNLVDPFGRPGMVVGPLVNVNGTDQHQRARMLYADAARTVTVTSPDGTAPPAMPSASAVVSSRCGPRGDADSGSTSACMVALVSGYSCASRRITPSSSACAWIRVEVGPSAARTDNSRLYC